MIDRLTLDFQALGLICGMTALVFATLAFIGFCVYPLLIVLFSDDPSKARR